MNDSVLGFIAGFLTSIAALPQLIRTLRTRHVRDLSLGQPLLLSFGVGLWLVYGIRIGDKPLIIANIITLLCNLMLTYLKLRYRNQSNTSA